MTSSKFTSQQASPAAPPHNIEAEEAVIGSVLIDPESFFDVAQFLKADDFYIVKHRWIWDVFTTLHDSRTPIDLLTVQEELERRRQLAEMGGPAYLTRLITLTPTAYNAPAYGRLVEEAATRRRLINAASDIAKLAYDVGSDINTVADNASKVLDGALDGAGKTAKAILLSEAMGRQIEIVRKNEELASRGEGRTTPTGWCDVDRYMGGWYPGAAFLLIGKAGSGKSLAIQSSLYLAASRYHRKVLYITREMLPEDMAARHLHQQHGITSIQQMDGKLTAEEWVKFEQEIRNVEGVPFWIDSQTHTLPRLAAVARQFARNGGYLVAIDYLQLIEPSSLKASRNEQVAEISRLLKSLTLDEKYPLAVIAISSVSREWRHRKGTALNIADARDSGDIEHDFDNVLAIHPTDAPQDENVLTCPSCGHPKAGHDNKGRCSLCECRSFELYQIQIIKNRRGPKDITVNVLFDPCNLQFKSEIVDG